MQKSILVLLAALIFWAVSCGKQPAGANTATWEENKARVEQLSGKYPNFKPVLQAVLDSAEAKRKAAQLMQKRSDQENALQAANELIGKSFVLDLGGLEDRIKLLKTTLATEAGKIADKTAWATASAEAQNILTASEQKLQTANPADASEAQALVEAISDELSAAQGRLQSLISTN